MISPIIISVAVFVAAVVTWIIFSNKKTNQGLSILGLACALLTFVYIDYENMLGYSYESNNLPEEFVYLSHAKVPSEAEVEVWLIDPADGRSRLFRLTDEDLKKKLDEARKKSRKGGMVGLKKFKLEDGLKLKHTYDIVKTTRPSDTNLKRTDRESH